MGTIDRLHAWAVSLPALQLTTIVVRVLLALAFAPSGLVKIMNEPFTLLPNTDPVGYFFAGFFSAHGYYRFVGVTQWTAAALLVIPRTATLGAFVYMPIAVNIFAITLAIGPSFAGTRLITGAMVLANAYLLFWDWDRWRNILPVPSPATARHGDLPTALRLLVASGIGFWGLVRTHLARIRDESYVGPLAMVAVGTVIGIVALASMHRRACQRRAA
jgi:uncharacterized membrane protein YphA (DoxX/SURF4 family)